jgi:hypothetical protein
MLVKIHIGSSLLQVTFFGVGLTCGGDVTDGIEVSTEVGVGDGKRDMVGVAETREALSEGIFINKK